jgi:hypothetical protein
VKSGPISPNRVCAMPVRLPGIFVRFASKDALEFGTTQSGIGARGGCPWGFGALSVAGRYRWGLELIQRTTDFAVAVCDQLLVTAMCRHRLTKGKEMLGAVVAHKRLGNRFLTSLDALVA